MADNVIQFNDQERLLIKVRRYISAMDQLISDGDQALELLIRAFSIADDDLKLKIVLMLGTLARPRVVWPLLKIMCDDEQAETICQAAAIQLSVVGGIIKNPDKLVDRLLEHLGSKSARVRANAAFALGWEGNRRAAPYLIDCLSDTDIDVQQAAVNALSNLRDDGLFKFLSKRLQNGAKEQQRSILYNLGHFPARHNEIVEICKTFLHHADGDLRYDALVVLISLGNSNQHIDIYKNCLDDTEERIRYLALLRLSRMERRHLTPLAPRVRELVEDPSAKIRQAATRLVHYMDSITIALD